MDAVKFVNELELEEHPGAVVWMKTSTSNPVRGKTQGFVDGGSLVSFASNVTGQLQGREDVLYSTLLAQLAANKAYNRYNDAENWYKFYTDVLEHVGWVVQDSEFGKCKSSKVTFNISQITLELLSALIGPEAELMAVVKGTIDNLAKSPDGVALYGSSSAPGKNGNFQIIPCTVDSGNQINVAFIGAYFKASQVVNDYFFFTYSKQDIQLFKSAQTFTFHQDFYSKVRDTVKNKLVKEVKTYILDLDI